MFTTMKKKKRKMNQDLVNWTSKNIKQKWASLVRFVINADIIQGAVEEISAVIESQVTAAAHIKPRRVFFTFVSDAE